MILSDKALKQLLASGHIVCDPLADFSIQPASIDCRLGRHFLFLRRPAQGFLCLSSENSYEDVFADSVLLEPQCFLLATTEEYIKLPSHITAFVEGRSSIGRMGLFVQNAGWVDPGFEGRITLELFNASHFPIRLEAGRRICQLVFCSMDQPATHAYRGKYQGQNQAVGSRIHQDGDVSP